MTLANSNIFSGSSITFHIPARLKDVRLLGLSARACFENLGFDAIRSYQLELAVTEAATNIVKYGGLAKAKDSVCMTFTVKDNNCICTFIDQGKPVEFIQKKSKSEPPVNIESFEVNRRGICIIHQVMDIVSYASASGKNVLTLTKHLS